MYSVRDGARVSSYVPLHSFGKICYNIGEKGMIFMRLLFVIGFILVVVGPMVWYYAALGKRISAEEKKAGRDLSDEINPFTGGR